MPNPTVLDVIREILAQGIEPAAASGSSQRGPVSVRTRDGLPYGRPYDDRLPELPLHHPLWDWNGPRLPGNVDRAKPPRYAAGGPVDLLAQTPVPFPQYTDWYQRMYGPYGGQVTDAIDPNAPFVPPAAQNPPGWSGLYDWLGGVGGVGGSSGAPSGPTQGVNSTSNSPGMQAVQAAIGLLSPVPGIVSIANMAAQAVSPVSSMNVPGIATVDQPEPGQTVGQTIAAIDAQTQAAVNAGIASSSMGDTVDASGNSVGNVGATPGIGPATQSGESPDPGTPAADTSTDDGNWARGGLVNSPLNHTAMRRFAGGARRAMKPAATPKKKMTGALDTLESPTLPAVVATPPMRKASHRPIQRAALGHL